MEKIINFFTYLFPFLILTIIAVGALIAGTMTVCLIIIVHVIFIIPVSFISVIFGN
ncbi:MAG: hypothetical protein PHW15_03350 [Patescibacteria group bacterium]|jgi:hypothetical protein|nr:hypothetical protein [Patescibacteria group bacterium]